MPEIGIPSLQGGLAVISSPDNQELVPGIVQY